MEGKRQRGTDREEETESLNLNLNGKREFKYSIIKNRYRALTYSRWAWQYRDITWLNKLLTR
jgi:hypothetical protein